uniref:F-box protein 42 n=1 Tax=Ficedula albicollis TaxID=59894 RepID=A0A803VU02_FICAL
MASSSDSDDDGFMAVDAEDAVVEGTMEQEDEPHAELEVEEPRPSSRSMLELPEEVLEYILSFLSPYQEHKTAALVCKQWYRLIKGVAHQCYHGFIKAVQEGNIQWESRTYPYPGTPITQRFSHSACYYDANQSMYVFGGCTQSSCNAAFNDLWRLDLNSKEWIRPLASGELPPCLISPPQCSGSIFLRVPQHEPAGIGLCPQKCRVCGRICLRVGIVHAGIGWERCDDCSAWRRLRNWDCSAWRTEGSRESSEPLPGPKGGPGKLERDLDRGWRARTQGMASHCQGQGWMGYWAGVLPCEGGQALHRSPEQLWLPLHPWQCPRPGILEQSGTVKDVPT